MLRNGLATKGTRAAAGKEIRAVPDACRGAQGEEWRTNAEKMKQKFERACGDDGEASRS